MRTLSDDFDEELVNGDGENESAESGNELGVKGEAGPSTSHLVAVENA